MSEEKKESLNIYQKLLEVRKSVDRIGKDGVNNFQKYKYVSSTAVLKSIREEMNRQGLLLKPDIINYLGNGMFDMTYTWVNIDNPQETIQSKWFARGDDAKNKDQALGRALTYSEKYFILKFFQIPTDEDDPDNDKNAREKVNEVIEKVNIKNVEDLTFEESSKLVKIADEKTKKEIETKVFKKFKKLRKTHSLPKDYLVMTISQYNDYCAKEDKEREELGAGK